MVIDLGDGLKPSPASFYQPTKIEYFNAKSWVNAFWEDSAKDDVNQNVWIMIRIL